jgi:DNA-binding XRE family transcriptional regulator
MAEQAADPRGGSVALLPGDDQERAPSCAPEHQGAAQPGCATPPPMTMQSRSGVSVISRACSVTRDLARYPADMARAAQEAAEAPAERVRRRLRELRRQKGMTLDEAAARAGMDPSTLSRLESGARRLAIDYPPAWPARLGSASRICSGRQCPPILRIRTRPRTVDGMSVWPLTAEWTARLQARAARRSTHARAANPRGL